MLKITFVVGAGKLGRQRYDPNLTKYMGATLRDLGFEEDRAASACMECQGTFKQQHDTDKNIKTLHVFPRVTIDAPEGAGGGAAEEPAAQNLSDLGSPGYLASVCAVDTFEKMVLSKTQSWAQRRRLLSELNDMMTRFKGIEQQMIDVVPLSPEDQELYDLTSTEDLQTKITWLNQKLKNMVEQGEITAGEKQQLLVQVEEKIATVETELGAAVAEGKPKKEEKLKQMMGNVQARKQMLETIEPIRHPLKHEKDIKDLRLQVIPLEKLEATKGRLLTMAEMKKIGQKPELEDQIAELESQSRGWFEDDVEFQTRCDAVKMAATKLANKSSKVSLSLFLSTLLSSLTCSLVVCLLQAAAAKKAKDDEWETVGSMGKGSSTNSRSRQNKTGKR